MNTEQNNRVSDSMEARRVKMLDENVRYMHCLLRDTEVIQLFQEAINGHLEAFGKAIDDVNDFNLNDFKILVDEVWYYMEYLKSIFAVTQCRKR